MVDGYTMFLGDDLANLVCILGGVMIEGGRPLEGLRASRRVLDLLGE